MRIVWIIVLTAGLMAGPALAGGIRVQEWAKDLQAAVQDFSPEKLSPFFQDVFWQQELESWKYPLQNGRLQFPLARVMLLDNTSILLHVPTDNLAYSHDHEDVYFDYLFRIYKLSAIPSGQFQITGRAMTEWVPDFLESRNTARIDEAAGTLTLENTTILRTERPVFCMALEKSFQIAELLLDGKNTDYTRLGYYLMMTPDGPGRHTVQLRGSVTSSPGNNQFFSVSRDSFFLRPGGLAVLPSPPPDDAGRYHFPAGRTEFHFELDFPAEFKLLHYGDGEQRSVNPPRQRVSYHLAGTWDDSLAFYARQDWQPRVISQGRTSIGFYFTEKDRAESGYLAGQVRKLLAWLNRRFAATAPFHINFVVLDKFYVGGLLNDGHSIVAQNAAIMGREGSGYLHEICHAAPQPVVAGRHLWINEGFTNYLAFDYLDQGKADSPWWRRNQRIYTHDFPLRAEPLSRLNDYRYPTAWWAYMKGPWIFRMLESLMGAEKFSQALVELGRIPKKDISLAEYQAIFSRAYGQPLDWFFRQWLERKDHPVVRLQGQFERIAGRSEFVLHTRQAGEVFRLPLDVELDGSSGTERHRFWLGQAEETFRIPVNAKFSRAVYDPGHLLFAVLQTGRCSSLFPEEGNSRFSGGMHQYRGDSGELEFSVRKDHQQTTWTLRRDGGTYSLQLDKNLIPQSFSRNGQLQYALDMEEGVIRFPAATEYVAEPVYPRVFLPFLLAAADWRPEQSRSLLVLNGEHSAELAEARMSREKESAGWLVRLKDQEKFKLVFRNGILTGIVEADGKAYELSPAPAAGRTAELRQLIMDGEFTRALNRIEAALSRPARLSTKEKNHWRQAKSEIQAVQREYTLTRPEVAKTLRSKIPDLTEADLDRWERDGSLEFYLIEGAKKFYANCVSDLFLVNTEAARRAGIREDPAGDMARYPLETIGEFERGSGLPRKIQVSFSFFQETGTLPDRTLLKAWIPFVRENRFQTGIRIVHASEKNLVLPGKTRPAAMIYFEKMADKSCLSMNPESCFANPAPAWIKPLRNPVWLGGGTFVCQFIYEYESRGCYQKIDPGSVPSCRPADPAYASTAETGKIQFTPYLAGLAGEITEGERNDYLKARKIYEWICKNVKWTDPKPVLGNPAEYTAKYRRGDCSAQSDLFIVLCRICGIPARLQGGWMVQPGGHHAQHSWAQVYFEPYGWLPVDVTIGASLIGHPDERARYFYFGNCTPYHLIIYDDDTELEPAKAFECIFGGGFQLGAFEWKGGDLEPNVKIDSRVE